jgi:hypothetical protein
LTRDENMAWRRNRQKKPHQEIEPSSSSQVQQADSPETKPVLSDGIRTVVEKSADGAKFELGKTGTITPKAIFVYGDGSSGSVEKTTVVSLIWRNDFHKDVLRRNIREKALQEDAQAVILLCVSPGKGAGVLRLLVTARGVNAMVSVDYVFDPKAKIVSHWDLRWLDNPHDGNLCLQTQS